MLAPVMESLRHRGLDGLYRGVCIYRFGSGYAIEFNLYRTPPLLLGLLYIYIPARSLPPEIGAARAPCLVAGATRQKELGGDDLES